jgi:hypothetical protein
MSTTSSKKHVVSHATNHSTVHVTPAPSPEVSALAPTLAAAAPPPITPPGDLPPTAGIPAPREGWEPSPAKKRGTHGLRPKGVQASTAQAVATEITQSATYTADFGTRAPAAGQVAFVITNAAKWRDTWQAARKFFVYAAEQRAVWENQALAQMDALKPAFEYAASRDGTVAEKYAATAKYLGATNAIAARGATTRKAKAKLKKTETPPAPPPAPTAAPETPAAPAVK